MPETEKSRCKKKLSESVFLTFRRSFGHASFFTLLLASILLVSCNSQGQKKESPQVQHLTQQLESSSGLLDSYTKLFQDLQSSEHPGDRLNFNSQKSGTDSITGQIKQDLAYLFDVYYQEESFADLLDTSLVGDTIIARVKPGKEKRSKLQEQKILKDDKGNYRFVSTSTRTSNWLYSLEISIEAEFDSLNRYQNHQLYLKNQVHYLNQRMESLITGAASY